MSDDTVKLYAQFISKQLNEDNEYSMDYDEPTKSQKNALKNAHKHIMAKGYKISHDGSDDPSHEEIDNPDITYHYAMGDNMHHAFTVHNDGEAANDMELQKIAKPLQEEIKYISNQLDEISDKLKKNYLKKAIPSMSDAERKMSDDPLWNNMTDNEQNKTVRDQENRTKGIKRALKNEDVKFSEAELNAIENIIKEGDVLSEDKEKASITKKVAKHIGVPADESDTMLAHVGSNGNHHTYAVGESHWSYSGEPATYITHDSSTGKNHEFTLPSKKLTVKQVHSAMNKEIPGGVSEDHAKAVALEHNT
jgi:hypothetical protein